MVKAKNGSVPGIVRSTMRENSEYMSADDMLRDVQKDLADALIGLNMLLSERNNERHVMHNTRLVAEYVMKAGRTIDALRGMK